MTPAPAAAAKNTNTAAEGERRLPMDWKVDFKELIPFLGNTLYKPENVLVELCANSYDADASLV